MHVVSREMLYKHNSTQRKVRGKRKKDISAGILITINKASRLTREEPACL